MSVCALWRQTTVLLVACLAGCALTGAGLTAKRGSVVSRVAADFCDNPDAAVRHYAVPPMSELQRLADAYPTDGVAGGTVRIVAARDEYEPGSFLVWATHDLGKVGFSLGAFKNEKGEVFPQNALDLKVVKVWYQNRNAWFSYFGDTGFKLCPELLLNDEDLIRVDTKKVANYAKLVDADGKVRERWLNPPRQFDLRFSGPGRRDDTFENMRPDFHDAKTLQPVALPKNEFRQFFLTAHVAKDTPAGLYRGEVEMRSGDGRRIGSVPVEIRVLDFTLPQPKCYAEPEKDFLVGSYSYISFDFIQDRNGRDPELARRQFVSILKNQVAHNQTMHFVRGNFDNEAFETISVMKETGMRTDVFVGGAGPVWGGEAPAARKARAKRIADEFDRRYGHHNVYMGYGDEPGAKWFADQMPVYEDYQSVGLKFLLADGTVFSKAGYFYDWHNAAYDAADSKLPSLWAKMQGPNHVAWYASQHVGNENPAFNRRQNGLGAYLAGYTALCNYAHHLGPYNDDSTTYKPMVLAYGSYDGVIDTLAWEGFREGIDDIRYATLLTDLARKAQRSKDRATRVLGGKAMHCLAVADPKSCDQDAMRGEMIRYINALKGLVDPFEEKREFRLDPAAQADAAKRADAALKAAVDEALAKMSEAKDGKGTNKVHKAVADVYRAYGREDEGGAYLERVGRPDMAVEYYSCLPERQKAAAKAAYEKNKSNIYSQIPSNLKLVETDYDQVFFGKLKPTDTNGWRYAVRNRLVELDINHPYVWGSKSEAFAAVFSHLLPLAKKWNVVVPQVTARNAVWAYTRLGDRKTAAAAAREGLKDTVGGRLGCRYFLGLAAALADVRGKGDAYRVAAERFNRSVTDEPNESRVAGLCDYGSLLQFVGCEEGVRGLEAFRQSLYRPCPKKRYVVKFSETPVVGFDGWDKIGAESQPYDRRYGGSLEFLETDVTTGTRATGKSKDALPDPTMQVVADSKGLHVLIAQNDPKSSEVALGLVNGASFEGYIAPGANTPYDCFIYWPANNTVSIFNTTYPTFGERPMSDRDVGGKVRFETDYAEGVTRHHFFFSWEIWMQRIPHDGTVWDFENMCWHRSGNSSWTGLDSIHGRSTFGELEFRLTEAQRAKIVKPLLVTALRGYRAEKVCQPMRPGALEKWQDAYSGDPSFYNACVKSLVVELDDYAKLLAPDISDSTVFWLEKRALPGWQDVAFEVDRRRAAWLLEKNAVQSDR